MREKIVNYLKCLGILSILTLIPAACSQGAGDEPEPVIPEPPGGEEVLEGDSVMVSFAPQSLEWSVSPMSRASSDDLYAVRVYQSNNEIEDYEGTVESAIALFDDPNLISLKLAKNQYYHFVMVYIPNGKNVIEKIGENTWGAPFSLEDYPESTPKLNSVVYSLPVNTTGFVDSPSHESGKGITNSKPSFNSINEVLRYMGVYRNFKPNENNQKVPIALYRWQYGIKITATDFKEGTIKFMSVIDKNARILTMQSNSSETSTMEYNLEFPTLYIAQRMLAYENANEFANEYGEKQFTGGEDKKIVYVSPGGEEVMLWSSSGAFPFKRMKMHTLEFSLSDAIANGGISPDLIESPNDPMDEVGWNL